MTPITDTRDETLMRLCFQQQFSAHQHESVGEIIHILRNKVARALAEQIVREEKFFSVKVEHGYGTQQANCIVMTEQEYADKLRRQFKKGIEHAQGFITHWDGVK